MNNKKIIYINSIKNLNYCNELLLKQTVSSSYLFSEIILSDFLIKKFINKLMRDGKKYLIYHNFEKSIIFLKQNYKINGLDLIRFLFNQYPFFCTYKIKYIGKHRKKIVEPILLEPKQQYIKLVEFIIKRYKILKDTYKTLPFYKQLSLTFLYLLYNPKIMTNKIRHTSEVVFQNRFRIKKIIPLTKKPYLSFTRLRKSTRFNWSRQRFYSSADNRPNRLAFNYTPIKLKKRKS